MAGVAGVSCCLPSVFAGRRLRANVIGLLGTISSAPSHDVLAPLFFDVDDGGFWAIASKPIAAMREAINMARNIFENGFNMTFTFIFGLGIVEDWPLPTHQRDGLYNLENSKGKAEKFIFPACNRMHFLRRLILERL